MEVAQHGLGVALHGMAWVWHGCGMIYLRQQHNGASGRRGEDLIEVVVQLGDTQSRLCACKSRRVLVWDGHARDMCEGGMGVRL